MHDFLHSLYAPLEPFILEYGLWALFLYSYTEAIFQPLPVDLPLGAMSALGEWSIYSLFLVATIASIVGGATAYWLGGKMGKPYFIQVFGQEIFDKGEDFLGKWGMTSVILAAATPIPFKVVAWLSGILHMSFWKFMVAQTIGRASRFAAVLGAMEVLKKWGWIPFFGVIGVVIILGFIFWKYRKNHDDVL